MTSKKEDNPIIKVLEKHGYRKRACELPGVLITEPITEENFKEFQDKLRALVPPEILEKWDKEDEENHEK